MKACVRAAGEALAYDFQARGRAAAAGAGEALGATSRAAAGDTARAVTYRPIGTAATQGTATSKTTSLGLATARIGRAAARRARLGSLNNRSAITHAAGGDGRGGQKRGVQVAG